MAKKTSVRLSNSAAWLIQEMPVAGGKRRGAVSTDPFVTSLAAEGSLKVVNVSELRPVTRRGRAAEARRAPEGLLTVEAETAPNELHVLMARHGSGAITFHLPTESRSVRRGARKKTIRFLVPVSESVVSEDSAGKRRSIVTKAIRTFLLKVTGAVADLAMPALGRAWETAAWKLAKRVEGWKRVTAAALESRSLPVLTDFNLISSDPSKPNLLLIHGTFSNAAAAFHDLGSTRGSDGKTLFESMAGIYDDRIFAFDHFSVSRSPEENVRMMIEALPNRGCVFDVITHSRGGLVLRHVVELRNSFGSLASRFMLQRAALVASPNAGTPLASPQRFDHFLTWISNVIDLFPDNPFTEGMAFVSEGLGWLAHRVAGALPGLAAMDSKGTEIAALQGPGRPEDSAYSALASNFEPNPGLLRRMADAGVDVFFGSANDLVVPTEGGWRVDPAPAPLIPGERIGCYGRGGNLPQPAGSPVSHVSFFGRTPTVDFLVHALRGDAQALAPIDPLTDLPFLLRRGAQPTIEAPAPAQPTIEAPAPAPTPSAAPPAAPASSPSPTIPRPQAIVRAAGSTDEVFHVSVLDVEGNGAARRKSNSPEWAILMATFRNARAVGRLQMRGGDAGKRFQRIITTHRKIRDYVNGKEGATELPQGEDLVNLGCDLFETLFPGDIRRLYDVARAEQINRRINLIFTSQVPWLADLPWEFVYDPSRETFLAATEVNFTRNVITQIPGDRLAGRSGGLRILVVVAQPLGLAHLSVEDEKEVIISGFRRLIDAGLASVEVLLDGTPALLHQTLEVEEYDVLHFIGHGEYNADADIGCLVFEDEAGGVQKVDSGILQQIICRRNIRLVFLNACETGEGGRSDFNRGVAPALVQAGVPAVVGNQYSVLDVSATAFARHFYWALAQGRKLGDAAREARVAVNYLISGEAIDWAVPVLFARDPAERLCEETTVPDVQREKAAEQRRSRRRSARDRTRVALWDVQRIIPHLDKIADALTQAQEIFAFEAVSIPAPLGTWRREPSKPGAYLIAENVAERLREKPKELGVDRLIAFTNLRMRDSKTVDLFAWEDPKHEISLFSTYDLLKQLEPPALSIERMVANAAAGFMADLTVHRRGAKSCPFYYNDERAIEWIAGPLRFCGVCSGKLDHQTRDAVERLLRVYE